jgi:hypothetical protein
MKEGRKVVREGGMDGRTEGRKGGGKEGRKAEEGSKEGNLSGTLSCLPCPYKKRKENEGRKTKEGG